MSTYTITLLTIFGVIGYMVVIDSNVAEFVNLTLASIGVWFRKRYLMLKLHPFWIMNPVGKYLMMRKYRRMAEDMLQSIKETQEQNS